VGLLLALWLTRRDEHLVGADSARSLGQRDQVIAAAAAGLMAGAAINFDLVLEEARIR
jgi:hypothetical protein